MAAFPEFVVPSVDGTYPYFKVELLAADPRLADVLDFIVQYLGLKPCFYRSETRKMEENQWFEVQTQYTLEKHEIEDALFYQVSPVREMGNASREKIGDRDIVQFIRNSPPKIGYIGFSGMCCLASLRNEFQQEGFIGLDFLPVEVRDPRYGPGDLWWVWASRTMPRTSMAVVDDDANSVKDDYSTGCWLDDAYAPLQYHASDLVAMAGVDFALTVEKWNSARSRFPR